MQLFFKIGLLTGLLFGGWPAIAQALPGMNGSEVVNWSRGNRIIAPLKKTVQYENDQSNFNSVTQARQGWIQLYVFLDPSGFVYQESLRYLSNCSSRSCSDIPQFSHANRSSGFALIEGVFGKRVLQDFRKAKLLETTDYYKRYQGKLYNYEVSAVPQEQSMFTVLGKPRTSGSRVW